MDHRPDSQQTPEVAGSRLVGRWRSDAKRRPQRHVAGPIASGVFVATASTAIAFFCAAYLVILFRWGGHGSWPILGIMLASVGFVIAVGAVGGWLVRRRRGHRSG